MATYHSFDFSNGKALWINIKTNKIMENRVKEAASQLPALAPGAMDSCAGSFAATLATHLLHIEWCDENWRRCINDFEKEIREILSKAQTARIDQQPPSGSPDMERALSFQPKYYASKLSTDDFPEKAVLPRMNFSKMIRRLSALCGYSLRRKLGTSSYHSSYNHSNIGGQIKDEVSKQNASLRVLDTFSFDELQKLHFLSEQLESFQLVMDLDCQTLSDIAECYGNLWDRDEFPPNIKNGCKKEFQAFIRRMERTRKDLLIRTTQVKSLITALGDGKELVNISP
ncbi:hypothetical protein ACHAPJ_007316 [Fusarium lateritium]